MKKQQHTLDLELERGPLKNKQLLLFATSASEQFTEYGTNTLRTTRVKYIARLKKATMFLFYSYVSLLTLDTFMLVLAITCWFR